MMSNPQYQHLVAQLDSELGELENKAGESSISRPSKPTRQKVILTSGLELDPRPVRWLWKDWLALGKMHILAGAPGQGKTTIALACAAIVSKGGCWPDGSKSESGNILIWSGEDDPADTLLPRLLMAGADRARCYFVSGTQINGEEHSFDPARDMADLEAEAIRLGGIKLIVVDPVVSAVAGDGNKNNEVRRALQPLVDLAIKLDAAVIGISHFSKAGQGGDPATRVVGSVAFTAVARVVLVAAKVKSEDGHTKRILARGKSNIGPDEGGFEYHIEQGEPIPGIGASFVTWGKAVEGSARELFAENEPVTENAPDKTARENAEEFLIQLLKEGICPSRYVQAQAKEAGLSWATVKRASQSLGLKKRKVNESWYWERPNLLNQLTQDAQLAKSEQVEQVDEQVDPDSSYAEVSLDQNFSEEF